MDVAERATDSGTPPSRRPVMNGDMPLDDERQTEL
jgi:hypothetical protein